MTRPGAAQLITPQELITYPTTLGGITIDLAFATNERLLECQVAPDLDFSSDHLPISIAFQALVPTSEARPSRCWKKADWELASYLAEQLDTTGEITVQPGPSVGLFGGKGCSRGGGKACSYGGGIDCRPLSRNNRGPPTIIALSTTYGYGLLLVLCRQPHFFDYSHWVPAGCQEPHHVIIT
ncbi:hypothetical protein ACMFMG_011666 [Clarireedia jacksonii]